MFFGNFWFQGNLYVGRVLWVLGSLCVLSLLWRTLGTIICSVQRVGASRQGGRWVEGRGADGEGGGVIQDRLGGNIQINYLEKLYIYLNNQRIERIQFLKTIVI